MAQKARAAGRDTVETSEGVKPNDPPNPQALSQDQIAVLAAFADLVMSVQNFTMFQAINGLVAALPPASQDATRKFDHTNGSGPYWSNVG